ncbi:hypothetical protein AGLY_006467 [Aphis glycines]|uniref:TTF-type domain-containing protein n=1 Tax=Aphis glycines TaxID=307491 RepID=A0A6G0TR86_APHGL|nr:hypothetical protein AGLY_006467 [Aphis glycines]
MDIRNVLTQPAAQKRKHVEMSDSNNSECDVTPSTSLTTEKCFENNLGEWVGRSSHMTASQKMEIFKHCWIPSKYYNFKKDAYGHKIIWRTDWLETYSPWLKYSKKVKSTLCLYCVLFSPINVSGVLGSFIIKSFTRYKHVHEHCKNHLTNQWHQNAIKSAKSFTEKSLLTLDNVGT